MNTRKSATPLPRRLSALTLLCLAALITTACSDTEPQARQAANELLAAWPDSTALQQCVQHFDATMEQLRWPWQQQAFASHFLDMPDLQSDTLAIAASLIAMDAEDFAIMQADAIVDGLLADSLDRDHAADRVIIISLLAPMMRRNDHADAFADALDQAAEQLPLDRQMLLYSKAASPDALARALAEDLNEGVDPELTRRRAEALRALYTPQQRAQFDAAYAAAQQ